MRQDHWRCAVTFSNNVCSKTTVIQYNSKSLLDHNIVSNSMIIFYIVSSILISVELNSTSFLIIESRDCIDNSKEYSVVVTITDIDTHNEYFITLDFNTSIRILCGKSRQL